MKILIVQGAFLPVPPLRGGAVEKMWFLLGKEFSRRGHQVVQISRRFSGLDASEVIDGVRHIRVSGFDMPGNLLILKLLDLVYTIRVLFKAESADVIVSNTFWLPFVFRFKRRGVLFIDVARMPKGQIKFYSKYARFRANSKVVERAILAEDITRMGATCMIPNPLTFSDTRLPDLGRKKRIVLFAGRIHPEKGIELLLEAFQLANNSQQLPWELRFVGPFDYKSGGGGSRWFRSVKLRKSMKNVTWVDPIYDVDLLNREYEVASIFAYPSLAEKGETFGLAPLEAMAWGCVPLVSDLECFKDFIVDGENGFVFDHRSPFSINIAASLLGRLMSTNLDEIANQALLVRGTHDVGKIAGEFLADFDYSIKAS